MNLIRVVFVAYLSFSVSSTIFSEEQRHLPVVVKEFGNNSRPGQLYYSPNEAPDIDKYGNDLVFDPDGNPIVFQWEQKLLYFFDGSDWVVKKTQKPDLPLNVRIAENLYEADGKLLYFWNLYGLESAVDYNGKVKFRVDLRDLDITIRSLFYHANVLFFTDDQQRLHSVANPSEDQEKNKDNYLNPEQTRRLFEPGSGVNLDGLSISSSGNLLLGGSFISNGRVFHPIVNQLMYIGGKTKFWISSNERDYATLDIRPAENEVNESTAVHPSGDIYVLRFNSARGVHILYKFENTWDPEAKKAWEARK